MGMTKTPKELAEEYASDYVTDPGYILSKSGFLAGYQAAKDQLADADKVMNSSNNSNGWISVKERLPEVDQWCSWWDISGASEPCTAFRSVDDNAPFLLLAFGLYADIELWWKNYTHWMPLPAAPKEDK